MSGAGALGPVGLPPGNAAAHIRLSGMPAYGKILDEKEVWQVTLLLANADELPPSVQAPLK